MGFSILTLKLEEMHRLSVLEMEMGRVLSRGTTAPIPSEWMAQPIRSTWLTDPLILDSSFQMMILWCFQNSDTGSLPTIVGNYRQYQRKFPKDGVRISIKIEENKKHATISTIEFLDIENNIVAKIDGYECVVDASLNVAFKRNEITPEV